VNPPPGAVEAARRGWAVFPTRPGGKEPRPGLSWPSAATADLDLVARAHWQSGEGYGIAAKKSGLVILDLDRPKPGYELPAAWRDEPGIKDGWDVLAALAERAEVTSWPTTFTVTTPGGGAHLYYLAPEGRPIGNRPAGPLLDVRGGGDGNGGYVLGPGTVLNGRAYEIADDQDPQPLPGWIADLLDPPQVARTSGRPAASGGLRAVGTAMHPRLLGVVEAVLNGTPGDRNGPLFWAACRAGEMVAAGQLDQAAAEDVLLQAAVDAGLRGGEAEARRTIASGLRRGTT
jgi:Bifunctional DNA primase/polymerase, N-terminal